jgi:hypothetical protein
MQYTRSIWLNIKFHDQPCVLSEHNFPEKFLQCKMGMSLNGVGLMRQNTRTCHCNENTSLLCE